ncbi:Zinc metalloproteinase nas-1 [Orchesella cincta]|uniref:Zinc metalloproteinase nas-1 n=1 Tax=Orchesella cincta TaxID=48709 RepID=A0A1D2MA12_ORCCI|nr:Zinc metalloproteinase nas-1 [Orchesella cincta]
MLTPVSSGLEVVLRQPWDPDYVNIEINETTCGYSNVCRLGGYQFAQFGQNCRNMNTMIHELGHSLCLGHEHQRQDRNFYLEFNGCPPDSIHPAQDYTNAEDFMITKV